MAQQQQFYGTGRRKSSTARVYLRRGSGKILINEKEFETFFQRPSHQILILEPLKAVELSGKFDLMVTVRGGGNSGQAGAVRHGLARALVAYDEGEEGSSGSGGLGLRKILGSLGFLTRDSRKVERKKVGRPKARKDKQFSKR
ncbi:MAG: 30S ribosomal protein S9 [Legionellales bacterium]|jgi:small subunit ribosomal protein S9